MKELLSASAAIGGKLEDALTRTVVPGATLKNIVALAHSKAKAKAVAEVAKATARAKARKVAVKVKERETARKAVKEVERREARKVVNDHGPVRPAEQHLLRGTARLRAGDRLPKIRQKYACYTPKGRAKRVTRIVRLYTTRHVYFIKPVNAEMGLGACSRTEPRKVCLPLNRLARN